MGVLFFSCAACVRLGGTCRFPFQFQDQFQGDLAISTSFMNIDELNEVGCRPACPLSFYGSD